MDSEVVGVEVMVTIGKSIAVVCLRGLIGWYVSLRGIDYVAIDT